MKKLIIIGAGNHAKVVLDIVRTINEYQVVGFAADGCSVGSKVFGNYSVKSNCLLSELTLNKDIYFVVAIGDNKARRLFFENAITKFSAATLIHPSVVLGSNVTVQGGSVILPLAFVNTDSFIGENSIVGAGVLIDHDVKISSHSHLRMGTKVNSKVILPEEFESKTGEVML
jgi:acetyltransferase EpsM